MSGAAAIQVLLPDRGYKILNTGIVFTRTLSLEEWRSVGRQLAETSNRTAWAIGDWLVYGEGRGKHGSFYEDAAKITRWRYHSLSQAARVSRVFPLESRSVDVPWSYYREVLPLPTADQHRTLLIAAQNTWTRDDLADFIKGRAPAPTALATLPPGAAAPAPAKVHGWKARSKNHCRTVQCPSCGFKWEPRRRPRAAQAVAR